MSTPSPVFRSIVLRAVRRAANRVIVGGVGLALGGAYYQSLFEEICWPAVALIGLGCLVVIGGLVMHLRVPRRAQVRALFESPERVASVAQGASGRTGAVRIIYVDGQELTLALSERHAKEFATEIAWFCPQAEVALPWLQRQAGTGGPL